MSHQIKKPIMRPKIELSQIDQLKRNLTLWVCDVDFWKDEIHLSQNRLDKCCQKINKLSEKKKLEQFQNQIIYYRDELLDEMKHDLLQQQRRLDGRIELEILQKQQHLLQDRMNAIEGQMKNRRKQLDQFISNL